MAHRPADELARHPRHGQESPPTIMARLRVSDTNDERLTRSESSSGYYNHRASSSRNILRPSSDHSHSRCPSLDRASEWDRRGSGTVPGSTFSHEPTPQTDYDQLTLQRSISYQHPPPHSRGSVYYDGGGVPSGLPAHRECRAEAHYTDTPTYPPSRSHTVGILRPSPWPISTGMDRSYDLDDDDRTPVALYAPPTHIPAYVEEPVPTAKYECQYCGKGFNRPSSLKIHLNSHTGEKPFACPVEGCGRSFSVLSNMRRHARVHTQPPGIDQEVNSDTSDRASASQGSDLSSSSSHSSPQNKGLPWHQRRSSIASTSSSASRRSRSDSSEDERPDKRSRQ
ncbi:hypothetical protein NMY22_g10046 [Coprinellus aureogranulatus]|nr:hypothetical protein NMY22_g10046 [Coprinellus aureogranulatus]